MAKSMHDISLLPGSVVWVGRYRGKWWLSSNHELAMPVRGMGQGKVTFYCRLCRVAVSALSYPNLRLLLSCHCPRYLPTQTSEPACRLAWHTGTWSLYLFNSPDPTTVNATLSPTATLPTLAPSFSTIPAASTPIVRGTLDASDSISPFRMVISR